MPRTARALVGGHCYHVISRDNARAEVFPADGGYQAFLDLLHHASQRIPMRILAYCLMPNHFHLAPWSYHDGDLSRWMHWLLTAHVRRYHTYHESSAICGKATSKRFPSSKTTICLPCCGTSNRIRCRVRHIHPSTMRGMGRIGSDRRFGCVRADHFQRPPFARWDSRSH